MNTQALVLLIAALLLLAPLWLVLARLLRRRWRLRHGLPCLSEDARSLLSAHCPLYSRMPPAERLAAEARTLELLGQLRFMGCGGLALTEAMRLSVAFQASLLLGRFGSAVCTPLSGVLIYPDSFVAPRNFVDAAGVVTETAETLSGETLDTSSIVLSWADIDAAPVADGYNVVLHEFAHFLDHALDGALSAPAPGQTWHTVLRHEYAALRAALDADEPTLIDAYGAEDPAEFFAVATETFFELPREMHLRHPDLYRALAGIYALDPAGWS